MSVRAFEWLGGYAPLAQLSQDETVRAMRWAGREAGFNHVAAMVLSLAALAGLGYLAYRLVRYFLKTARRGEAARGLFQTLATRHGLRRQEKKLLEDLAARTGLEEPAALFVRRSFLEREVNRTSRPEVRDLLHKLFD